MDYHSKPVTPDLNRIFCAYSRMFEKELDREYGASLKVGLLADETCDTKLLTPSVTKPGSPLPLNEQHHVYCMEATSLGLEDVCQVYIKETDCDPDSDDTPFFAVSTFGQTERLVCGFDAALAVSRKEILKHVADIQAANIS